MATIADSGKYITAEFRVSVDPQTDAIYLSSKDDNILNHTAGGFRMKIEKGTKQDQALRATIIEMQGKKRKEISSALPNESLQAESLIEKLSKNTIDEQTQNELFDFLIYDRIWGDEYYKALFGFYLRTVVETVKVTITEEEKFIDLLLDLLLISNLSERKILIPKEDQYLCDNIDRMAERSFTQSEVSSLYYMRDRLISLYPGYSSKENQSPVNAARNERIQLIVHKSTHQKMSNFAGHQGHTVPLGISLDTLDRDTNDNLKSEVWNWKETPHLFITGPVASGKTTLLNNMERYLLDKKISVFKISLTDRKESLKVLTSLEHFVKCQREYDININIFAQTVVLVDELSIFDGKAKEDFNSIEESIYSKLKFLIDHGSRFGNLHFVLVGIHFNNHFGIKQQLLINQGVNPHRVPIVQGEPYEGIDRLLAKSNRKYYSHKSEIDNDIMLATIISRDMAFNPYEVSGVFQIALYQFDE